MDWPTDSWKQAPSHARAERIWFGWSESDL